MNLVKVKVNRNPIMKNSDRILHILSYIGNAEKPVSPKELEEKLHIPISSIYRILNTLMLWEYVTHSHILGFYTLGAQSLKGRELYEKYSLLTPSVEKILTTLMEKSNESAAIIVSDLSKSICVSMIESKQALRCSFIPGKGDVLIRGASGKTLLAFYDEPLREKILKYYFTDEQKAAKDALIAELHIIQKRGYGRSVGEIDEGVLGVSAPIFRQKQTAAVVTLMAPYFRSQDKEQEFIQLVMTAAHHITDIINHN